MPANVGIYKDVAGGAPDAARRHLHDRSRLHRHQSHLGRNRRRADPDDGGWRQDLDRRDAAGADAVGKVSIMDASHTNPLGAYAAINTHPPRRSASRTSIARTTAARPGRTSRTACPTARRSTPSRKIRSGKGLLFAGTRNAGLRVVRRRRSLAVAAAEHAGDVDPRSRDQGRRPRRRHARPRLLDSRRHHPAARDRREHVRRRRASVQARRRRSASSGTSDTDTPLPPDEPAGQNPPDGAIIDYSPEAAGFAVS